MRILLVALWGLSLQAEVLLQQAGFQSSEGWTAWSHRAETMPRTFVDARQSRGPGGSLAISGASNAAAYGGWRRAVSGIQPGQWLQFQAYYRTEGVAAENWQVVARLDWQNAAGKRVTDPEYMAWATRSGDWTELTGSAEAPAGATQVVVELLLANAPQGTVWWHGVKLERVPKPTPRPVTVATVNLRPQAMSGPEQSVSAFLQTVAAKVPPGVDLILLPEGITVVGTGKGYVEVAESIPGPTTRALGAVARARKSYIAAGIYEREGATVYNSAVLIDRNGEVAGKYRKVYLPNQEIETGLTPGASFPVFHTDFGTVGLMICYDVFFSDPARFLANQGAEMILLPIWGGDETLAKARAIENGVFLITSGYDHPTYVMDPYGERLSQAKDSGSVAVSTIDLAKRYRAPYLGEMRTRRLKELRTDVVAPMPGALR